MKDKRKSFHLMSFLPSEEKIAAKELKNMISHFIICHKQALHFHGSIEPIPELFKKEKEMSGNTTRGKLNQRKKKI